MKRSICFFGIMILSTHNAWSQESRAVSVTRFDQQAQHILDTCRGWDFTMQDQLRTVLERELSTQGLQVVERRDIRQIYDNEFEMPNLDKKTKAKEKKFIAAKYTVSGGITEMGICEESSGNGLQLGGIVSLLGGPSMDLGLKNHHATSTVKVTANIVSVETGEILNSFEASSKIEDSALGVSAGAMGIGASHEQKTKPPIERAANQAIHELAGQIVGYLNKTPVAEN